MRSRRCAASAARRSTASRRARRKPFTDLADFARRINPRAINKRVLESLVAAGAFDALGAEPRPRVRGGRHRSGHGATLARGRRARPIGTVRRPGGGRAVAVAGGRAVAAGRAAAARIRRHRLFPERPSARRLYRRAQAPAGAVVGGVFARREGGRRGRAGRRHGRRPHRAADQDRQQDGHHRPVRSERPLRGGAVRGRARAISRSARARHRRAACS